MPFFDKKKNFPTFYGAFFGKLIKKTSENILEKSIIYKSMHLYLLFPTVKTAALYHVPIKSYSKNGHPCFISEQILEPKLICIKNLDAEKLVIVKVQN